MMINVIGVLEALTFDIKYLMRLGLNPFAVQERRLMEERGIVELEA